MSGMKALVYQPSTPRWIGCKMVGSFWPGVYWSEWSGLKYKEVAEPKLPSEEWVRVRTLLGGICGTDLALLMQKAHPASYLQNLASFPAVLGHENVAIIEQAGSKVPGFVKGDRVCVEPALHCAARGISPICSPCRAGRYSLCEKTTPGPLPRGIMIGLNSYTSGSWAPYFVAHYSQLHRVPAELPDEQAVLTDPMACALHGVLRRVPQANERILVVGAGMIGLGVVASLRAVGVQSHMTAIARYPYQVEWLRRLGADEVIRFSRRDKAVDRYDLIAQKTGGRLVEGRYGNMGLLGGYDVVYDCIGSGSSMTDSLKFTRAGGTTVLMGTSTITLLDTTTIWNKELTIIGVNGRQMENAEYGIRNAEYNQKPIHTYEWLFELISQGKIKLEGLLTHQFELWEYRKAFKTLTSRQQEPVIKAVFRL